MKKQFYLICTFVLLSSFILGCTQEPQPTTPTPEPAPEPLPVDEDPLPEPVEEPEVEPEDVLEMEEPAAPEPLEESTVKEFSMVAKQWDFEPSSITVHEGDTVKLSVTSEDVTHGIALSAFGVSETLKPGEIVDIEFVADTKGTHSFFCSIPCGAGHGKMRGTLIVK